MTAETTMRRYANVDDLIATDLLKPQILLPMFRGIRCARCRGEVGVTLIAPSRETSRGPEALPARWTAVLRCHGAEERADFDPRLFLDPTARIHFGQAFSGVPVMLPGGNDAR